MRVIKKDGTLEKYDEQKIINACNKAAKRAMVELSPKDYQRICDGVWGKLVENDLEDTEIHEMHNIVESVLEEFYPIVAKMYKEYRNYKKDFIHMMDKVYEESQKIRYIGDKDNANTDSALVATKRSLIFNSLNGELYKKFFLTTEEKQAAKDGYIYIHDRSARLDTVNCFRRDTRFITKDGVKSFYDFNDGDETIVLSHKGNWRKATVHKYGWQPIQKVTFKKGVPTSKEKEIYCTANHRWILKDGRETTNLSIGDVLYSIPDKTKTGQLNNSIYDLLNMSGYYVTSTQNLTEQKTNYGSRSGLTVKYQLSSAQNGNSAWRVKSIEPEKLNPKAEVWCLEVKEDHSFILEGGIPTGNCCLFRMGDVMSGGFEMGNVWYNEPKTLDTAFDVMGDIILSTAAQQYGFLF